MKIIPILIGGLGNRLYQIANGLRLQELYNSELQFYKIKTQPTDVIKYRNLVLREKDFDDFGGHELKKVNELPKTIDELFPTLNWDLSGTKIDEILLNRKLYFENRIDEITNQNDCVIMGYFFSYNFVETKVKSLKKILNKNVEKYVISKYPDLFTKKILGIHLRLGIESDNTPAISVEKEFYNKILTEESKNFDEIYIVSDNVSKSKNYVQNFELKNKTIKFIENEPMYVDMLILSYCYILIVAPSTLSSWSSYFSVYKNIYVPKIWTKHHWTNIIPKEWKIL